MATNVSINSFLGAIAIILAALVLGMFLASSEPAPPVPIAGTVDPLRYEGAWFSVYEIPQRYAEGCTCSRALYSLTSSDSFIVTNRCIRDGETYEVLGEAVPRDATGASYDVTFQNVGLFNPKGSYNILVVGSGYEYALVGDDERKSLWMLSRSRSLSAEAYSEMVQVAISAGYDVSKLVAVDHSTCPQ